MNTSRAILAIFCAGALCGVMDGLSAMSLFAQMGTKPLHVFQGIASGLLGRRAFDGGTATAMLGVALHFVVAFGAAAVYFAASRWMLFLLDHAVVCGILYGALVHLFMSLVVIPLSAIGRRPFVPRVFLAVLVVHMMVVGPSIAVTIRYFSK